MHPYFARNLLLFAMLLLLCAHFTTADDATTPANSEENDSSSEETVEDSNEKPARKRRSIGETVTEVDGGNSATGQRLSMPGLPDPATIIKIAEIVQEVGEKVIPLLVEGNTMRSVVAERLHDDYKFLKQFKSKVENLSNELKLKKK